MIKETRRIRYEGIVQMQVLIVDDDIATVDVIKTKVNWDKIGISGVFTAYNMERAKKILQEQEIGIVISDIEMPQGSGLDLLTWFREQGLMGEFLFLTCHESFDYATNAVRLHAAEYLLKPFDPLIMEAALKKLVLKCREQQIVQENNEYGKWLKKNRRQLQLDFWNMVLDGHLTMSPQKIAAELKHRNLDINTEEDYILVVSKITDIEHDRERINPNLMLFVLENIHSEILCGNPENLNVLCHDYKDYYVVVTICRGDQKKQLEKRCEELIQESKKVLSATLTCCISSRCDISSFYSVLHNALELISANVVYYGTFFQEEQGMKSKIEETFFLELNVMEGILNESMLNEKKKMDFLSYLKRRLGEKTQEKTLTETLLQQAKQEVLQVVYAYLAARGIQASGLFVDETCNSLTQKASQSVIDMMRWSNYLLERTFSYENEVQKSYTIVDKMNQYIREHYRENIGRNEIAAQFYLTPEYLGKMYKKQTGISLKEYITDYRIEQAKILLKKGEVQVSDVAEAVGFENFTYFSTIFKKSTGMTPNQYRKQSS